VATCRSRKLRQNIWEGRIQLPKTGVGIGEVDQPFQLSGKLETFIGNCTNGFLFRARNGQALEQSNALRRNLDPR